MEDLVDSNYKDTVGRRDAIADVRLALADVTRDNTGDYYVRVVIDDVSLESPVTVEQKISMEVTGE